MSEFVNPDFFKISAETFKPAVTNNVYTVSIPIKMPVFAETAKTYINQSAVKEKSLYEPVKTVLNGLPNSVYDSYADNTKRFVQKNIKNKIIPVAENKIKKSVTTSNAVKFGTTFAKNSKRFRFSGKMKAIGVIAAAGLAAYSCFAAD